MPASHLALYLANPVDRIAAGREPGCVILIDDLDETDADWRAVLAQYVANTLDAEVQYADEFSQPYCEHRCFATLSESIFVVGEVHPV